MPVETVSQTGPIIAAGIQSSGFQGKMHQSGQSHPEQTERGTKQHKRWPVDERLVSDLPRGRGKSVDGDLDIDEEGS
jgi:hypothetical protein